MFQGKMLQEFCKSSTLKEQCKEEVRGFKEEDTLALALISAGMLMVLIYITLRLKLYLKLICMHHRRNVSYRKSKQK
jgi:uncharacterized protein (DUF983 family)